MADKDALSAMLARAFTEGFKVTREGFNGEIASQDFAPDGLTFEEFRDITVELMLADDDAEQAAKAISGSCGNGNTVTLTDEERAAIVQTIDAANGMAPAEPWTIATLRSLLARLA
jgi:hypothetical protein